MTQVHCLADAIQYIEGLFKEKEDEVEALEDRVETLEAEVTYLEDELPEPIE